MSAAEGFMKALRAELCQEDPELFGMILDEKVWFYFISN